jgi:hypothetical protein
MKKLTILLFSILISFSSYGLFGLFEKTVCVETDAQERNYLFYLPNQQEPFSGKNLCEYENGQKKFEGNIKDGKLDGKWTSWHENGQKLFERNIKDGRLTPNDEDKQPDGLYYNTDFDGNPNRYTSNPKNKNNCIDTGDTNFNGDPVWFCK